MLDVKIMKSRQCVTGRLDYALWSAMDAGMSAPGDTELRRLFNWLKFEKTKHELVKSPNSMPDDWKKYTAMICKTLCATQTADPRPSLHYRGKKWCVDGLRCLNPEKLSRLSLHFLNLLMKALPC
ncbi:uncharacterized protein LOC129601803 [Paramacrobiotus metropolitanus]|nr:uncharacterized protein LOC129601803 [Paramacrobiotus metropolitanus]